MLNANRDPSTSVTAEQTKLHQAENSFILDTFLMME